MVRPPRRTWHWPACRALFAKEADQRLRILKRIYTPSLYDSRGERWADHFVWNGLELVGLTATGRATVAALAMNRELIVEIRAEEAALGRHPPVEGVPDL